MKKLATYFPKPAPKKNITVDIDEALHIAAAKKMKAHGIGWRELIEAACKQIIDS